MGFSVVACDAERLKVVEVVFEVVIFIAWDDVIDVQIA